MTVIDKLQPITISQITGQFIAKRAVKAIIHSTYNSPKLLVLAGPYGVGKVTLAKAFARALNCPNITEGDGCGQCDSCIRGLHNYYYQYDASNVEDLNNKGADRYRVVCIDEAQQLPKDMQLKILELFDEVATNTFLVFSSTNTQDIHDNIYMRALVIRLNLHNYNPVKIEEEEGKPLTPEQEDYKSYLEHLERIQELVDIDKDTLALIERRGRGHLSDVHNYLESYTIVNRDDFRESLFSARELYICLLISCYRNKQEDVQKYIGKLKNIPLAYLKEDYESLILEMMKTATKFQKPKDKFMEALITCMNNKALDLYYILNEKIMYDSFVSDDRFQAAMYIVYLKLNQRIR